MTFFLYTPLKSETHITRFIYIYKTCVYTITQHTNNHPICIIDGDLFPLSPN